jgi:hypothetical protein
MSPGRVLGVGIHSQYGGLGVSYDSWKCVDPAREGASDFQMALDAYEQEVWREVVRLIQKGGEVVSPGEDKDYEERFDGYRDQLHDLLLDDRHPVDAAELFLERDF